PTTLPARLSIRSLDPPSPMPVMPMSVSTVTRSELWLKLRFMLGCVQHFTRVTVAFGSAASTRAGRMSPAPIPPSPIAADLKSDLRFIMTGASSLSPPSLDARRPTTALHERTKEHEEHEAG